MYAVIATGGKQYTVRLGETVAVEKLAGEAGSEIELVRVLMLADGDQVTVGQPEISGAKVVARVIQQGKGKKLLIFKYKAKKRYRRKTGHRQLLSYLLIKDIITADGKRASESEKREAPATLEVASIPELSETAEVQRDGVGEVVIESASSEAASPSSGKSSDTPATHTSPPED